MTRGQSFPWAGSRKATSLLLVAWLQAGALLLPGAGLAGPAKILREECVVSNPVEQIAPGAFVMRGMTALPDADNHAAIANVGFIIGEQSVAVIDTGGSLCHGLALRAAIRDQTDLPVRYIVNTHVHPDHIFGNAAFADDNAMIIGHRNLPRALAERGKYYLESYRRQVGAAQMKGTRIVPPHKLVEKRLLLDLGKREIEITAYPAAHTDNDLTVYDKQNALLWTGDLVFLNHVPVLDGSLSGWLAVISEMMKHEAKQIVPGHGPAVAPWPEAGENQQRYLSRLADDVREAISKGTNMQQTADKVAKSERANWRLFDSYNRRNAIAGYAELEWE